MKITKDNYEAYFLQYAEGLLSNDERSEVEAFICQYPELQEELNMYDPEIKLQGNDCFTFENKESLLHSEPKKIPIWIRYASVAVVGGAIVFAGYSIFENDSKHLRNFNAEIVENNKIINQQAENKKFSKVNEDTIYQYDPKKSISTVKEDVFKNKSEVLDSIQENIELPLNMAHSPILEASPVKPIEATKQENMEPENVMITITINTLISYMDQDTLLREEVNLKEKKEPFYKTWKNQLATFFNRKRNESQERLLVYEDQLQKQFQKTYIEAKNTIYTEALFYIDKIEDKYNQVKQSNK